jgi:tellurite resistance protein
MSADGRKLDDVAKSLEEQYFAKHEHELLDAQRRKVADQEVMRKLGAALGLDDQEILAGLREEGLGESEVALVFILPSLEVAWSDGRVGDGERARLEELLRDHSGGAPPSPEASARLASWIVNRPPDRLFDRARRVAALAMSRPNENDRRVVAKRIFDEAVSVAEASGGVLGFGTISSPERRVLDTLRSTLGIK